MQIFSKKFIKQNAAYGVLESTIPPWSIPAWNAVFSGVKPKKMKLYSFIKRQGNSLTPVLRELDDQVYIWDLVSMRDEGVLVVNVPCVSRAISVNGYFVAGFLANRSRLVFPFRLNKILNDYGYIVDVTDLHPLTDEEYLEVCLRATLQKTALFLELSGRAKWRLGVIVYTHSDRIQHRFLKTRFSFVEKYYEVLDTCIARLLDRVDLDNTVVFVISDHGFKIPKATFSMNTWLTSRGYLSINSISAKLRVVRIVEHTLSNSYVLLTAARKTAKILRLTLHRNIQPVRREPMARMDLLRGAYMPSEDGTIYIINIADKVRRVLADRIAKEIKKSLPEIKVHRAAEIYGVALNRAPDLILESDSLVLSVDPALPLRLRTMRATHAREGVFMAMGPQRVVNLGFKGYAKVYDVAPTILYVLGLPIPSYMDGRVLTRIFADNFIKRNKESLIKITYEKARIKSKIYRALVNKALSRT